MTASPSFWAARLVGAKPSTLYPSACAPSRMTASVVVSRFPNKERLCMPGSKTTQGRPGTRNHAPVRLAFRHANGVGALN